MRRCQCNPQTVPGQHAWAEALAQILHLRDGTGVPRVARGRCLLAASALGVAVVPGRSWHRSLVFACPPGFERLPQDHLDYRTRFGIETRYRQLGECLARTACADPVYRLLLVGVNLLIRAWWIAARGVTLGQIRWTRILIRTPVSTDTHQPETQTQPPTQPPTTA